MTRFGGPHRHLAECASTNDIAREWASDAADPAPSGALVTANFQTRGRGQRGHEWQAQAGQSALMSFVYRLPPEARPAPLALLTALAAAEALETLGAAPQIKWPNDILLTGKKCGGILVEVASETAILGIGINVSQTAFAGVSAFAYAATSLRLALGHGQSVSGVVDAVSASLSQWEEIWRREGLAVVVERCRGFLAIGAQVQQGVVLATLIGLTDEGAAQVRLPDGTFAVWITVS